jgi:hypothetical protein
MSVFQKFARSPRFTEIGATGSFEKMQSSKWFWTLKVFSMPAITLKTPEKLVGTVLPGKRDHAPRKMIDGRESTCVKMMLGRIGDTKRLGHGLWRGGSLQ